MKPEQAEIERRRPKVQKLKAEPTTATREIVKHSPEHSTRANAPADARKAEKAFCRQKALHQRWQQQH